MNYTSRGLKPKHSSSLRKGKKLSFLAQNLQQSHLHISLYKENCCFKMYHAEKLSPITQNTWRRLRETRSDFTCLLSPQEYLPKRHRAYHSSSHTQKTKVCILKETEVCRETVIAEDETMSGLLHIFIIWQKNPLHPAELLWKTTPGPFSCSPVLTYSLYFQDCLVFTLLGYIPHSDQRLHRAQLMRSDLVSYPESYLMSQTPVLKIKSWWFLHGVLQCDH